MAQKKLPLEGVKVVELGTVVAAPTTARVLCAYGAEVIKVEAVKGGDLFRGGVPKIGDTGGAFYRSTAIRKA